MTPTTALRSRNRVLACVVLAAAVLGLPLSGSASGYPVVDIAHIKAQIAEFAKEAARWGEQGQQWLKEAREFQQQYDSFLSSISNMQSNFGLTAGSGMEEVNEGTYMVEERCGPAYGEGATGVFGRLTGINMQRDIHAQRWELCAKLQIASNRQYNEVVRYLNETAPRMQTELDRAGRQFEGSNRTQGDMSAYSAKMEKVKGDIARSDGEFQARMRAYDAYTTATMKAQGSLSRNAMRGSPGLMRQMTSTAVMYERLCGGGQCEDE